MQISARGNVKNLKEGTVAAQHQLKINAKNLSSDNQSAFLANSLHLDATEKIHSEGVHSAQQLLIESSELDLTSSQILAEQASLIAKNHDGKLSNAQIDANHLNISTPDALHTDGAIIAADVLKLNAEFLNNHSGTIEQRSEESLVLSFEKGMDNTQGSLISAQDLQFEGKQLNNSQGQIVAHRDLALNNQTKIINTQGLLGAKIKSLLILKS